MTEPAKAPAILAAELPPRSRPSVYPEPFASRMAGREKRPLGDSFGLTHFGVNLTRLAPGAASALRHAHTRQDEFLYILSGRPTLITDEGETELAPGMSSESERTAVESAHSPPPNTTKNITALIQSTARRVPAWRSRSASIAQLFSSEQLAMPIQLF
jgi:uncharacterized cupin superfamily protein